MAIFRRWPALKENGSFLSSSTVKKSKSFDDREEGCEEEKESVSKSSGIQREKVQ